MRQSSRFVLVVYSHLFFFVLISKVADVCVCMCFTFVNAGIRDGGDGLKHEPYSSCCLLVVTLFAP